MRRLATMVAIAALAWTGLWLVARGALEREVGLALAAGRAAGRLSAPAQFFVAGFPGRFDLFLDRIILDNPETGTRYRTTDLRASLALWRPWAVRLVLPRRQDLTLSHGALTFSAGGAEFTLALRPRPSLPLDLITIDAGGLHIAGPAGSVGIDDLSASFGAQPEGGASYALSLVLHGIAPDQTLAALFIAPGETGVPPEAGDMAASDGRGVPPAEARGTMTLDLDLELSAPIDRHMNAMPAYLLAADLQGLRFDLGDLHIRARGRIEADDDGLAQGEITARIAGWQVIPDALARSGAISASFAPVLHRLLEAYARQQAESAADQDLTLVLRFLDGRGFLGPFPLGPAPRLAP